jgi:hypothetical protein
LSRFVGEREVFDAGDLPAAQEQDDGSVEGTTDHHGAAPTGYIEAIRPFEAAILPQGEGVVETHPRRARAPRVNIRFRDQRA